MTETLVSTPEDGLVIEPQRRDRLVTKLSSLAVLSSLAAFEYASRKTGFSGLLPSEVRPIISSCAHPVLGYAGAWLATATIAKRYSPGARIGVAFAAATAANFGAEIAQNILLAPDPGAYFLAAHNLPETVKDYAAALTGAAFLLGQDHAQELPENQAENLT